MKLPQLCILISVVTLLLTIPIKSKSQETKPEHRYMHHETPDDPYIPQLKQDIETSPAYRSKGSNYFTVQVNVDADGDNILWDAANEPSIAVDPNNPNRMLIGWRQFDYVVSNFRQAGYGYSSDAGQTWTFPQPIEAGIFRSDPVLDIDSDGNFYYNSLTTNESDDYWCNVFKTSNDSFEWDEGTFAQGGDKQWMEIDKSGGIGNGNIYAIWNSTYSICSPGSYTRSIDNGLSYQDCDGILGNPFWGTIAIGPDGEMYTVGSNNGNGVVVTRSSTAQDPTVQTTWDFAKNVNLDGFLTGWAPINPEGLLGQAWIDTDKSNGSGRGNVYVLASVEKDNGDPCDVMFARSTDRGLTWGDPIRINDDPTNNNWQWFGTMSVAPNGRIDIIWLDTRDAPMTNQFISELYYSYSIDQGVTWSANESLSEPFNPKVGYPNQEKMGDYFEMISNNEGAHLAWANTMNGEQDVYYTFITPWFVGVDNNQKNEFSFINYPNPVINSTTLKYELTETAIVSITILDILGNTIETILNEVQESGTHNITYDASRLKSGIYLCQLSAGTKTQTIKLTIIE